MVLLIQFKERRRPFFVRFQAVQELYFFTKPKLFGTLKNLLQNMLEGVLAVNKMVTISWKTYHWLFGSFRLRVLPSVHHGGFYNWNRLRSSLHGLRCNVGRDVERHVEFLLKSYDGSRLFFFFQISLVDFILQTLQLLKILRGNYSKTSRSCCSITKKCSVSHKNGIDSGQLPILVKLCGYLQSSHGVDARRIPERLQHVHILPGQF